MSATTSSDCNKEAYARLAERILRRSVVPFLGAGFSYGNEDPSDLTETLPGNPCSFASKCKINSSSGDSGKCDERRKNDKFKNGPEGAFMDLCINLRNEISKGSIKDPEIKKLLERLIKESTGKLAHVSELASIFFGHKDVCSWFHMRSYANLEPMRSHRYLIYLVREGLVNEVITTNYDACLEKAFEESGARSDHRVVITSLGNYRNYAALYAEPGKLIIYKINGCAVEYKDSIGCGQDKSERIILTERQLQNFRQEMWARDLLCDRARTRTLLFSGFGSEEPQIRHTVLTLMQEFMVYNGENLSSSKDESDSAWDETRIKEEICKAFDLPNSPFIHSFDEFLSFYQLQIIVGFLEAHVRKRYLSSNFKGSVPQIFHNTVRGCNGGSLDSSVFMENLYINSYFMILKRSFYGEGCAVYWFRSLTLYPQQWFLPLFDLFNERFLYGGDEDLNLVSFFKYKEYFPLPFFRIIFYMKNPGSEIILGKQSGGVKDYYVGMREDPFLVSCVMVLISLIIKGKCKVYGDSNEGVGEGKSQAPKMIEEISSNIDLLFSRSGLSFRLIDGRRWNSLLGVGNRFSPDKESARLVRLLAVPSLQTTIAEGRWERKRVGKEKNGVSKVSSLKSITVGKWIAVNIQDVIREAEKPENIDKALIRCFSQAYSKYRAKLIRHRFARKDEANV